MDYFPNRIICLTEETTETLYLLEEQDRIIGISVYTVRPPEARKEKPRVSAFTDAKIDRILELKPDLVIGYSDIQADIAKDLIRHGITVWINNYRSIDGIYKMIGQLGSLVGQQEKAEELIHKFQSRLAKTKAESNKLKTRPKVYFEEWYEPLICGSHWVSELIEIAGGIDIFSDKSKMPLAKDRFILEDTKIIEANPDIILGSWCGKKFNKDKLKSRKGWEAISAVQNDRVYEIDSSIILQPGPAALTDGLEKIKKTIKISY